jgi:hypothetical protein
LAIATNGVSAYTDGQMTVSGLKNPESAAVGPDGTVYVTVIGEREKKGDGSVAIVEPSGKITTLAIGLGRCEGKGRSLPRPRWFPPSPRLLE